MKWLLKIHLLDNSGAVEMNLPLTTARGVPAFPPKNNMPFGLFCA